ncbi:MAG: glycosyltransferase family 2 protein [Betaproteobacteria bacterium]
MIVLICTLEPFRIDWLPQFVAHYRGIGVQRFLLTLQLEPGAAPEAKEANRERFRQALVRLNIHEPFFWEHEFDAPSVNDHERRLQAESVAPTDWIVWCDSDEFQVYPEPLSALIAQSDAIGVDYFRGVLIDRIAADYGLARFCPGQSIWDAYPRTCNVTQALAKGDPRKVTMTRGGVAVSGGKHTLDEGANRRTIVGWAQVHHFKWDASVIDRLQYRVRPEWKAKCWWWTESQRLLDYFAAHGSRFDPADLLPITLQGTHFLQVA